MQLALNVVYLDRRLCFYVDVHSEEFGGGKRGTITYTCWAGVIGVGQSRGGDMSFVAECCFFVEISTWHRGLDPESVSHGLSFTHGACGIYIQSREYHLLLCPQG